MEPLSGSHDTNDTQQQVVMQSVAFLIVILSVMIASVIMLIIMLNVAMLNVVVPPKTQAGFSIAPKILA